MKFGAIPAKGRAPLIVALLAGARAAAVLLSLAGVADTAEAKKKGGKGGQIVFQSGRTTGQGVNKPTGGDEIFVMNPDGTGIEQLTANTVADEEPALSPDGKKIAFAHEGVQSSNLQDDAEVYLMNVDGSGQLNLSNAGGGVVDEASDFGKAKRSSAAMDVAGVRAAPALHRTGTPGSMNEQGDKE